MKKILTVIFILNILNISAYSQIKNKIFYNPKDVIRNSKTDKEIRKAIQTKDKNYKIKNGVEVTNKANCKFRYEPYTKSVEAFIYYSKKSKIEIIEELKKYGVEFEGDVSMGRLKSEICIHVTIEKTGNLNQIIYSWECD